jgi:hypothetical protein
MAKKKSKYSLLQRLQRDLRLSLSYMLSLLFSPGHIMLFSWYKIIGFIAFMAFAIYLVAVRGI